MRVFWAVVADLWRFVLGKDSVKSIPNIPIDVAIGAQKALVAAPTHTIEAELVSIGVGYVAVPRAHLLARPVWMFDGVLKALSFGTQLELYGKEGMYYHVGVGTVTGWVSIHEVTTNEEVVFPVFVPLQTYTALHSTTVLVRQHLEDAFGATPLYIALSAEEYVCYRLMRQGLVLPWPVVRPRPAGKWHSILRGVRGIEISTFPRSGAIMEYVDDEGKGVVAYTKIVAHDQTITIEGIGTSGQYTVEVLSSIQWRELRPVWIMVI